MNPLEIYLDDELLRENLLVVNSRILTSINTPIKIYVAKDSALFSSESFDIAIEYLQSAYIGERLSKVANQVILSDVHPHETGYIGFELIQPNKDALISLLEEIIGHSDWDIDEDELNFMEQAQDFIEFAENNSIQFPELFERYLEFSKEEEEEEEED